MARLYDLARMTTATTGTGTITLASAATGFISFASAGVADGDTVTYAIEDGSNREIGRGVYTASGTTLTRGTILRSTNSNAAISLSGTAQVFIAAAAEDIAPQTATEQATVRSNHFASAFDAHAYTNLIINGAMDISQRYDNTLTTVPDTNLNYTLDQWEERVSNSNSGVYKFQQGTMSGIGLLNFKNNYLFQASTGAALGNGDYQFVQQRIEGLRVARLGFGTSGAVPVTIGFWVRSTISGTMAVGLRSGPLARSYVTNVAINAANTWEFKTVTIPGDTSGSYATDTTFGLVLLLGFGTGSTFQVTADAWGANTNAYGTSSTTNFFATSGNTVRIVGVIMLAGTHVLSSSLSQLLQLLHPFYEEELLRCRRYFYAWNTDSITNAMVGCGMLDSTTNINVPMQWPVEMPAVPSLTISAASDFQVKVGANTGAPSAIALNNASKNSGNLACTHAVTSAAAGNAGYLRSNSTSARLYLNARM